MKQLDQRVTKLEKAMAESLPNLKGMLVDQLMKLLMDNRDNRARTDLIYQAMSVEQLEAMYAWSREELTARARRAAATGQGLSRPD
jgi:hypothetical protein